jgi:hypothetical protein
MEGERVKKNQWSGRIHGSALAEAGTSVEIGTQSGLF